jgi:hypothetical protein
MNEGDVIYLKAGTIVFADIPERFVFKNKSDKLVKREVEIGKEYRFDFSKEDVIIELSRRIRIEFARANVKPPEYIEAWISPHVSEQQAYSFTIGEGEFVVIRKVNVSGSSAMGHDDYPDYNEYYCRAMKDGKDNPNGAIISTTDIYIAIKKFTQSFI